MKIKEYTTELDADKKNGLTALSLAMLDISVSEKKAWPNLKIK